MGAGVGLGAEAGAFAGLIGFRASVLRVSWGRVELFKVSLSSICLTEFSDSVNLESTTCKLLDFFLTFFF